MIPRVGPYRRSLVHSIADGCCYSAMMGIGEFFLLPYCIFLGGGGAAQALLVSLPLFAGSFGPFLYAPLLRLFRTRKRFVLTCALLQASTWGIIAGAFHAPRARIPILLLGAVLYWFFVLTQSPAWHSWMGDLVPEDERGRYYGFRSRLTNTTLFLGFVLGGSILHLLSASGPPERRMRGFLVLFGAAALLRLLSFAFLALKREPPLRPARGPEAGFPRFVRTLPRRPYGRLVLFLCLMNLGVFVASPHFPAYQLERLGFSYLEFTFAQGTFFLVKFLFLPTWGAYADRYGTRKALAVSGFLMPLTPLLWLLSPHYAWVLAVHAVSGFAWAGFELSSFNYIFDTTNRMRRPGVVAGLNALNGLAIVLGSAAGGALLGAGTAPAFLAVFLASGLLRLAVAAAFIPRLPEVREVEPISPLRLLLRVFTFQRMSSR